MGEKDITQKNLEDYNDVFADIINGVIYQGKQVVVPDDLENAVVHSQYKDDKSKLHEQERDVAKYWKKGNIRIALCGIENQSKPEKKMPVRIIGYEGASYRTQLKQKHIAPVLTLVLYFGTEQRWNYSTNLKSVLNIPEGMDDYVNDYKINVVEVAWLSQEEVDYFKSDFRVVANFFVNKRLDENYIPDDPQEIKHVDEVLKLLSVMSGDHSYEEVLFQKGKVSNMCEVAQNLINKGKLEGMQEGMQKGENRLSNLLSTLCDLGREADAIKAIKDEKARQDFYREFGIID